MSFAWRARVAVEVRYWWLCVVGVSDAAALSGRWYPRRIRQSGGPSRRCQSAAPTSAEVDWLKRETEKLPIASLDLNAAPRRREALQIRFSVLAQSRYAQCADECPPLGARRTLIVVSRLYPQ